MFSKLEIAGIAVSVTAMAAALYLLTLDNSPLAGSQAANQLAQTNAIFVKTDGDQAAALRDAVIDSVDATGNVKTMIIDDVVIGGGREIVVGDTVSVHYIGTLQNGQEFDNSNKRGEPFSFTMGEGRVIKGWEEGLVGMKEGGKRVLVIPSEKGYGDRGYGPIPGRATLVFAIDLVSVTPKVK